MLSYILWPVFRFTSDFGGEEEVGIFEDSGGPAATANSKFHWSSGSTVGFPPRGTAVHTLGVQLTIELCRPCSYSPSLTGPVGQPCASRGYNLQWFWVFLLALSRYIGDPEVVDHWPL
jgi:hypothetical protein